VATLVALTAAPALAFAQGDSLCAHPFDQGPCLSAFSVLGAPYIVIVATYAITPLLILKPQFDPKRWRYAAFGVVPACYLAVLMGFTLFGMTGLLTFPHDASPFFYLDWAVAIFLLLVMTGYLVAAYQWRGQPEAAAASA